MCQLLQFEDTVIVSCFPSPNAPDGFALLIRVPVWASNATINGRAVTAGTFATQHCGGARGANEFVLELSPEVRLET